MIKGQEGGRDPLVSAGCRAGSRQRATGVRMALELIPAAPAGAGSSLVAVSCAILAKDLWLLLLRGG